MTARRFPLSSAAGASPPASRAAMKNAASPSSTFVPGLQRPASTGGSSRPSPPGPRPSRPRSWRCAGTGRPPRPRRSRRIGPRRAAGRRAARRPRRQRGALHHQLAQRSRLVGERHPQLGGERTCRPRPAAAPRPRPALRRQRRPSSGCGPRRGRRAPGRPARDRRARRLGGLEEQLVSHRPLYTAARASRCAAGRFGVCPARHVPLPGPVHPPRSPRRHLRPGRRSDVRRGPQPLWERRQPADERNRIQLAARCLLIERRQAQGAGGRRHRAGLGRQAPRDVRHRSLAATTWTASWPARAAAATRSPTSCSPTCTSTTRAAPPGCEGGELVLSFPKATHHVQRRALEVGAPALREGRRLFRHETFDAARARGRCTCSRGATELVRRRSSSSSPRATRVGMQLVRVGDGEQLAGVLRRPGADQLAPEGLLGDGLRPVPADQHRGEEDAAGPGGGGRTRCSSSSTTPTSPPAR